MNGAVDREQAPPSAMVPAPAGALLHVVRAAVTHARGAPPPPWHGPVDDALIAAVVEHGLATLVAPVAESALPGAGANTWELLRQYAAAAELQSALLERRLLEASSLLRAAALPHLALKGTTLAALAPSDWPARQASDIDLLLPDADAVERATALLTGYGFEPRLVLPWEVHLHRPADGTVLDLHHQVAPRHLPRPFDFADLWSRRTVLGPAGAHVETSGRADTFVLLCLHLFKDALDLSSGFVERVRLDKIADLARFCGGDWVALERHAAALGCRRIAWFALGLADEICDLGLPADLRRRLAANPLRRSFPPGGGWLLSAATPIGETAQILIQLRLRDRLRQRLALLVTPSDEDRRNFPLPPSLAPLHYLLRPLRLAARGTGLAGRRERT